MTFQTIRHAQQKVRPRVRESLTLRRAAREAVAADPASVTAAAKARARKSWNDVVMEETVWAMAKEDLLATPELQYLVKAARAWAASWQDVPPNIETDDGADVALYEAIQGLASSLAEFDDTETLTGEDLVPYVPFQHHND